MDRTGKTLMKLSKFLELSVAGNPQSGAAYEVMKRTRVSLDRPYCSIIKVGMRSGETAGNRKEISDLNVALEAMHTNSFRSSC